MKILFLSAWFPYPTDNGSRLRINSLLRGLSTEHAVTLLAFYRTAAELEHRHALDELCDEVALVPWREFSPRSLRALAAFADVRPRSLVDTFSQQMDTLIRAKVATSSYDLVIASELPMAVYHRSFVGIPALLEDIELAALYDLFQKANSMRAKVRRGLTWTKTRRYVKHLLTKFDGCTVVSEQEKDLLTSLGPSRADIYVVPNCIDAAAYAAIQVQRRPNRLIFTGPLSYSANWDAMAYFLTEIWPIVRRQAPDAELRLTGRVDETRPPGSDQPGVFFTGYVADIKPEIAGSTVSIVPLLSGGGTRLKILEAMALGTPVVSTAKGAEGLAAVDGEHLLLADTPGEFAAAVLRLLGDEALCTRISDGGRRLVHQHYDWRTTMPQFLALVDRLHVGSRPSASGRSGWNPGDRPVFDRESE